MLVTQGVGVWQNTGSNCVMWACWSGANREWLRELNVLLQLSSSNTSFIIVFRANNRKQRRDGCIVQYMHRCIPAHILNPLLKWNPLFMRSFRCFDQSRKKKQVSSLIKPKFMFKFFSESTVRPLHTGWVFGERILVYVWTGLRRSSQSQSRVWSKCCATCWSVSWLQKTRRRTAPKNFMNSILSLLQSGLLEEPCSRTRWVSGHMRWLPSGCKNRERFLFSYHNSLFLHEDITFFYGEIVI